MSIRIQLQMKFVPSFLACMSMLIITLCLPQALHAQKEKARVSLSFERTIDGPSVLIAKVLTKPDRSYEPVEGVDVNFYLADTKLGMATTSEQGFAKLPIGDVFMNVDSNLLQFSARLEGSDRFRDADDDVEIALSNISLTMNEDEDSMRQLTAQLTRMDSVGNWIPVSDVSVRFFVKRLFGKLPVDEGFAVTNEEGLVTVPFPDDIPGDEHGNLLVSAELIDNEVYGSVKAIKEVDWGVPVPPVEFGRKELWSSGANAPLYLVILVNGVIVLIWGVALYIILQLFKINRIGKVAGDLEG